MSWTVLNLSPVLRWHEFRSDVTFTVNWSLNIKIQSMSLSAPSSAASMMGGWVGTTTMPLIGICLACHGVMFHWLPLKCQGIIHSTWVQNPAQNFPLCLFENLGRPQIMCMSTCAWMVCTSALSFLFWKKKRKKKDLRSTWAIHYHYFTINKDKMRTDKEQQENKVEKN